MNVVRHAVTCYFLAVSHIFVAKLFLWLKKKMNSYLKQDGF